MGHPIFASASETGPLVWTRVSTVAASSDFSTKPMIAAATARSNTPLRTTVTIHPAEKPLAPDSPLLMICPTFCACETRGGPRVSLLDLEVNQRV